MKNLCLPSFAVLLLGSLLLVTPFAVADGAMDAANEIQRALVSGRLQNLGTAQRAWLTSEDDILDSVPAALKTAFAFAKFAGSPEPMGYLEIPEQCAGIAEKCADAAEKGLNDDDFEGRATLGQALVRIADVYLKRGHGDKADGLQDRARTHLEAVAAEEKPPVDALLDLGTLYGQYATREPPKADEWIAKAIAVYEKAKEQSGSSAVLALKVGDTKCQFAEMKEEQLARDPKDRKLEKSIKETWEEAIQAYEDGLKIDEKNADLKSAYNECLWSLLRVTEGKEKRKPIMEEYASRYRKITMMIPVSGSWRVVPPKEREDQDEVFFAVKVNRKAGQALRIYIDQYKWDTNYVNPETNDKVGGDNIGGLADRSEAWVKDYFKDIKERRPLRKMALSPRIRKAEGYSVTGMTKDGDLFEWKCWFFKNSKTQKTYRLMIIADMGMLKRNPYELEAILRTIDTED